MLYLIGFRLSEWTKLVALDHENPQTVYNKKRICVVHFSDNYPSPGTKRLNCNSVSYAAYFFWNIFCFCVYSIIVTHNNFTKY